MSFKNLLITNQCSEYHVQPNIYQYCIITSVTFILVQYIQSLSMIDAYLRLKTEFSLRVTAHSCHALWCVMPYSLVNVYSCSKAMCWFHIPEDGVSKFLQNISKHVPDYVSSYPRRQHSS
jgi:hypothetical protein